MAEGTMNHLGCLLLLVLPPTSSARQQFPCSGSEDAFGGLCHAVAAPGEAAGMCLLPCASCPVLAEPGIWASRRDVQRIKVPSCCRCPSAPAAELVSVDSN